VIGACARNGAAVPSARTTNAAETSHRARTRCNWIRGGRTDGDSCRMRYVAIRICNNFLER